MSGDTEKPVGKPAPDATRKEPVPPALGGSFAEPVGQSDRMEPTLGSFGSVSEPKLQPLTVPDDWQRRAERRGGATSGLAVAALAVLCVGIGGYVAWSYVGNPNPNPPSPAAVAAPTAPPAGATVAETPPPIAVPAPSPRAAPARQAAPTPKPRAARDAADRARREAVARARHAQAEQARQAAEQARKAAAEQTRKTAAEQARQAAAEQAREAEAARVRLAANRRHEEKLRAAHQRQEAARRTAQAQQAKANAQAQQEQAVQNQLDRAAKEARGGQGESPQPREHDQQNAKLQPQSLPGEGPPLDAGDLPPSARAAPSAPGEIH